ncbi:hypothetical protein AAC387_Pa02g0784 [Persea americana]
MRIIEEKRRGIFFFFSIRWIPANVGRKSSSQRRISAKSIVRKEKKRRREEEEEKDSIFGAELKEREEEKEGRFGTWKAFSLPPSSGF